MSTRKIPRALFEPLEDIEASELVTNESLLNLIKKETPIAIEEAFKNKKTFATLFEVNATGMYIDIPKQYFKPALEQCIKWYLEDENYEECKRIADLVERIDKGVGRNKKAKNGK